MDQVVNLICTLAFLETLQRKLACQTKARESEYNLVEKLRDGWILRHKQLARQVIVLGGKPYYFLR